MEEKEIKKSKKVNKKIHLYLIIIFICGIFYISNYIYIDIKTKKENNNILSDIKINETEITELKTERILQIEELQKINSEIIGWLEIEGTNINYPVLQAKDNDYYLTHNYKKEYSKDGSIFLDKDYDFEKPSTNLLLYGHNNKNGIMFEQLLKYKEENFYKKHKKIKFVANKEESEYEILGVFYSRVYYKKEENVFRYYYFIHANNEEEYNEFVNNVKKSSIYDTGITAKYGEQLLTLSTCEYSTEDGRFVVVAKKI